MEAVDLGQRDFRFLKQSLERNLTQLFDRSAAEEAVGLGSRVEDEVEDEVGEGPFEVVCPLFERYDERDACTSPTFRHGVEVIEAITEVAGPR